MWGDGKVEKEFPKTCPECNGLGGTWYGKCSRGDTYCINDWGDRCYCGAPRLAGSMWQSSKCSKCNGTTIIKEKKSFDCTACKGKGKWTVTVPKYKTCSSCSGSGKKSQRLQCPDCSGTGNILGDVNGDGVVNGKDRLLLTRWLAKWPEALAEGINEAAADVNCDGKINGQDRLILTRHLARWTEYATLPYIK